MPFAGLRCLPPGRSGPLAPASSAPASAPLRERSAHRTRIEAGPQGPSANSSPLQSAAPKRAMRILRLRKIVLLKPGSSGTWDWFQKDTLRVSVVRYDGCAARASGIQLSVYRVSADRILLASADAPGDLRDGDRQERPRDEKDDHCTVTFPLILDLSDLECRSSASGVPDRTNLWRIAFSVTP